MLKQWLLLLSTMTLIITPITSTVVAHEISKKRPQTLQKKKLEELITKTDLGEIFFMSLEPTKNELLTAIQTVNPLAKILTLSDFALVTKPSPTTAKIQGIGNYTSTLTFTYYQNLAVPLTNFISQTQLGRIDFANATPTPTLIWEKVQSLNPKTENIALEYLDFQKITDQQATIVGKKPYVGTVTVNYQKDSRIFLNEVILKTNLDYLYFQGLAPTLEILFNGIKQANPEAQNLELTDLQFLNQASATTATLIAQGNRYQGAITLTYQQDNRRNLNNIILINKLGWLTFKDLQPTAGELLSGIQVLNPLSANLTIADFKFIDQSEKTAIIEGQGNYKGQVSLTYQQDNRPQLSTLVSQTTLGWVVFQQIAPTLTELLDAIQIVNPATKNLTPSDLQFVGAPLVNQATLVAQSNQCKGQVTVTYQKDNRQNLTIAIRNKNLGLLIFNGDQPTANDLVKAIKKLNPDLNQFSATDFVMETVTARQATLKAAGLNYKGQVNVTYQKDLRTDLTTLIPNTQLGWMVMASVIPTLAELLIAIQTLNPESAALTLQDLEFAVEPTPTGATIQAKGNKYRGRITVSYQRDLRTSLKQIITQPNLGQVVFSNSTPTLAELLPAIQALNPLAMNLTVNDFKFVGEPTANEATLMGQGDYKDQVNVTYQKDLRTDLKTVITQPNLDLIVFQKKMFPLQQKFWLAFKP